MKPKRSVLRWRPLQIAPIAGRYIIFEPIIAATREAPVSFALLGIADRGHEGIVFWAGRQLESLTVFTTIIIPIADHSAQRVWVEKQNAGKATHTARAQQLSLLAQVHSHPCDDAQHSSSDDDMIFMPFEGMLSIVVPNYGINFNSITQTNIHQFQHNRWILCDQPSIRENIHIVPTKIDLR